MHCSLEVLQKHCLSRHVVGVLFSSRAKVLCERGEVDAHPMSMGARPRRIFCKLTDVFQ